jgi:thioredoxin 1
MFSEINSSAELESLKGSAAAILIYFSADSCNVCKSLKPKVETTIHQEFPKMKMVYVKTDELPETAGQHRVFTIPTVLVFFEGKETVRKIRTFSIDELTREIRRPYSLIFSE